MAYMERRGELIEEDEAFAAQLKELDARIEAEARAHIQTLDDRRALRKAGLLPSDTDDEELDDDWEDDEDGPEIIYVRD